MGIAVAADGNFVREYSAGDLGQLRDDEHPVRPVEVERDEAVEEGDIDEAAGDERADEPELPTSEDHVDGKGDREDCEEKWSYGLYKIRNI